MRTSTFEKKAAEIRRSPNHFCSRSCAATYHNQHKKGRGITRSKSEIYLARRIRQVFPELGVVACDRDIVPEKGMSVDITIPELQLAIEWHGHLHRRPAFGFAKLKRIQLCDERKKEVLEQKDWDLIVIEDTTSKFDPAFVDGEFEKIRAEIDRRLLSLAA